MNVYKNNNKFLNRLSAAMNERMSDNVGIKSIQLRQPTMDKKLLVLTFFENDLIDYEQLIELLRLLR